MTELNFVATRNRLTGVVDIHTPFHIYDHPVLGANLELVEDDAKPFVADLINTDRVLAADESFEDYEDDFEPLADEDGDDD
jgi:hypothetical protein